MNAKSIALQTNTSTALKALIVLAPLSYWIFTTFIQPISPFYKDYEAEITYFMNSLVIFKGESYYYLDHPGTPVEIIGSVVLGFFYIFSGQSADEFIQSQLRNPEPFFVVVHIILTATSIFCALHLYNTAVSISSKEPSDLLLAAAISLLYFAIHPLAFSTLTLWHHAAFNFPFGTLYLTVLLKLSQTKEDIPSSTIILLGLGAGFLTATMIYFAVWVVSSIIFIIVFYKTRKVNTTKTNNSILKLGTFSLLGFAMAMLPAANRIPYFIGWILNLIFHQGTYGGGEVGIISLVNLWVNFLNILSSMPAFSIFIFCALLLFTQTAIKNKGQFQKAPGTWALAISLIIQIFILLALNLKHPDSNTFFVNRYLLPIAATIPILTFLVTQLAKDNFPTLYTLSKYTTILFVLIGCFYFFIISVNDYNKKSEYISKSVQESSHVIEKYAQETNRPVKQINVLWTYETFSNCYSLWFGNELSGIIFSKEVKNICRQENALNIWNRGVIIDEKFINVENTQWDLIFTRKLLLDEYPFLAEMGTVKEYLPLSSSDFDRYGSFIVIIHKPD